MCIFAENREPKIKSAENSSAENKVPPKIVDPKIKVAENTSPENKLFGPENSFAENTSRQK